MCGPVLPAVTLFPSTVTKICNLSGDICVPVLSAVTRVTSYPKHSHKICNLSGDTCFPVLPVVTRVTLLPKHSSVNLQFNLRYSCPCVTCGYPCYPVTQRLYNTFVI